MTDSAYYLLCCLGSYCETAGLGAVTGDCAAGYYCIGGATIPNPTDNITGAICPEGHYCPDGTFTPVACPSGYYLNATGSGSFEDCKLCLAGTVQ